MTRINCIPVEELHDKHLLAEYRELPRVFKLARPCKDIPEQYVLGTGHVKFFYNKLVYCHKRQQQLVDEMKRRGFKPTFDPKTLTMPSANKYDSLYNDWIPDQAAIDLNRHRINERLLSMGVKS
jgi:deoxyribonuclease (pyrimidine dimer)